MYMECKKFLKAPYATGMVSLPQPEAAFQGCGKLEK
jgi:hypothetical protein